MAHGTPRVEKDRGIESLVAIPGEPDGAGGLALVLRGTPPPRTATALRDGFGVLVIVPEDGAARPIREVGPAGERDAGPDALLAAAATLRTRVDSPLGTAEPLPGGGYRVEVPSVLAPATLTPGVVGAALGLDPEFIADTGRLPAIVRLAGPVLVVPVEDRESVEEVRPDPAVLARIAPGVDIELVVLVVCGPEGQPLPEPLPLTVLRGGAWPRPQLASATAAIAVAALDGLVAPARGTDVLFTPAHEASGELELPSIRVVRSTGTSIEVLCGARRLL